MESITTLDLHTAGEPLRIIRSVPGLNGNGIVEVPGDSMLAKRRWAQTHLDTLRRQLMLEPRGHADMYGAILTPSVTADGDIGVLFLHNEGFSTMCGHGIIGLATAGLSRGLFCPSDSSDIRIDTPAGRVVASAQFNGNQVASISFKNVPSFMLADNLEVNLEDNLRIKASLAFGGAFYAYVDAAELDLSLRPAHYPEIVAWGKRIKHSFVEQHEITHPNGEQDLNFLYGVIFVEPLKNRSFPEYSRNVCVFAEGEVDRSPTGTGVSGRAAIHYARDEVGLNDQLIIHSLVESSFRVRCISETIVGEHPAVIPEVSGEAFVTGEHRFLIDARDPFADGFLLR